MTTEITSETVDSNEPQDQFEIVEISGTKYVKIGKWFFDPFLFKDSGNLGITVYQPDVGPELGPCVDISVANKPPTPKYDNPRLVVKHSLCGG